jgi:hypothetical protein
MLESLNVRPCSPHPVSTLRRANGDARSGSRHALDARPVLDVSEMRPAFLVHVFDPSSGQPEAGQRAGVVTIPPSTWTRLIRLEDDDVDEDDDDDEDFNEDDDESDDEDDEDKDADEGETWQVVLFG